MFEIKLSQGKVAIVDDEYAWLNDVKWSATKCGRLSNQVFYACRVIGMRTPEYEMVLMHRVILEKMIGRSLVPGEQADHIDHDGLNNQIANLRVTTIRENHCNQRVQGIVKSSKYKGVSWDKSRSKWHAKIKNFGKHINLGRFDDEDDAARAYDVASIKYHGEFGYLNFR
jgi:hypothetical protein